MAKAAKGVIVPPPQAAKGGIVPPPKAAKGGIVLKPKAAQKVIVLKPKAAQPKGEELLRVQWSSCVQWTTRYNVAEHARPHYTS